MLTSLELLVIVFMGLAALALLSLCLMFLMRNKIIKRVCFYIVIALAAFVTYAGLSIGLAGWFTEKIFFAAITTLMCIGAVVLDIIAKDNEKMRLIARILSAAALLIGMANAIL